MDRNGFEDMPSPHDAEMARPGRKQGSQKRVSILTSLDDTIGNMTPKSQFLPRTPNSLLHQPGAALHRSSMKPSDMSAILGTGGKSPLILPTSGLFGNLSMLDESNWTMALSPQQTGMFVNADMSNMTEDVTMSAVLLREDDPGEAATMSMYSDFLHSFLKHTSTTIFGLVDEYENICNNQVSSLLGFLFTLFYILFPKQHCCQVTVLNIHSLNLPSYKSLNTSIE